jgi:AAA15 family ATPase/GTPase
MITEIQVENFKSIQKLKLELGRITVLIGENGCGKSNILEAIAFASATVNKKLDNEFLFARGIRVTDPQFMRSAFEQENLLREIKIKISSSNSSTLTFNLQHDNQPYSSWRDIDHEILENDNIIRVKKIIDELNESQEKALVSLLEEAETFISMHTEYPALKEFLIYSPENSSLRIFEKEGQIQPLGINGEGLFKLLKVLSVEKNLDKSNELKEKLKLIDWFQDFEISQYHFDAERNIQIKDKYVDENLPCFDQKSSNEGFLFLLFYFALFISSDTPNFFAIDNIDASLNPKLCSQLTKELVDLSKKHDKQAIFTTHNPAILDGLNLDDDEQRLFVIYRNKFGHTKAKRILKPEPLEGQKPVKLSEAFMRGYIGGLPKGF